jgi:hypothetical protein
MQSRVSALKQHTSIDGFRLTEVSRNERAQANERIERRRWKRTRQHVRHGRVDALHFGHAELRGRATDRGHVEGARWRDADVELGVVSLIEVVNLRQRVPVCNPRYQSSVQALLDQQTDRIYAPQH